MRRKKSRSSQKSRHSGRRRSGRRRRSARVRLRVAIFKIGLAALLVWAVVAAGYYVWALTFDLSAIREIPQRSAVLDKDGKFYSRMAGGENRVTAPFDKISNHFVNALITREDTRFYSHHGVDPIGIARAIVRNFMFGRIREGASTITQQLARNSFPLGGKTLHRKLIEAALAFRIETELTKEEILEAYMNRIYFGSGFWGVETASRGYFGKPASRLTLSEAALLAGLIRSPSNFSPFVDPERSIKERDVVLHRMHELELIDARQLADALSRKISLSTPPRTAPQADWAMETIRRELALVLPGDRLEEGGLTIHTTLDPELQRAAERAVSRRLDQVEQRAGYRHPRKGETSEYLQGALLAIDNRTGGIRAIVGGRDYSDSTYHRAFDARRPIGSTAKPFVFAAAFANGLKPGDRISDARLRPGEIPRDLGHYDPSNADGKYGGDIRAGDALVHSRNTATVRVGLRTTLPTVADFMQRAGLAREINPYPAICLGAFETTLKDLTAAYTAFATGGIRLQPYLIDKVTDSEGNVLFQATRGKIRFLDEKSARQTSDLLVEVVTRGTASGARAMGLRKRAAGKTGTTDQSRDAWFVGYTKSLTCGVWVGFDQPRTILRGGSGADLALPIWVDIIQAANPQTYPD